MEHILNITNGDCAVAIMQQANIPGEFLPWRDVLHEGPVLQGLSLEALSGLRAKFISERGRGDAEAVYRSFMERDSRLRSHINFEKVILWFEHDLYDQLQLLQILDWFQANKGDTCELSLICTDRYLGMLTPGQMLSMLAYEAPVTPGQLELARHAWTAFRDKTPEKWSALLNEGTDALEFLEGAIIRMLEEYPDKSNGLSRTEQQALSIIAGGESRPASVFAENQKLEDRVFMGDTTFRDILNSFLRSSPPLLTLPAGKELTLSPSPDQALKMTDAGKQVLSGKRNWLDISEMNKWLGGVHLNKNAIWCRDSENRTLIKRA